MTSLLPASHWTFVPLTSADELPRWARDKRLPLDKFTISILGGLNDHPFFTQPFGLPDMRADYKFRMPNYSTAEFYENMLEIPWDPDFNNPPVDLAKHVPSPANV